MEDKDNLGVIRGCKCELINIIIYIVHQLSCCFGQEISLIIYRGEKNDYYLINFSSYYFIGIFSIIVLISLRYSNCGKNNFISNYFDCACVLCT